MIAAAFVASWLSFTSSVVATDAASSTAAEVRLVDLNAADVRTLCTLPGIGPKKAEAIVALRQHRPLTRVTQLLQVRGIGPRILDRLRGKVTLRPTAMAAAGVPEKALAGRQVDAALRPGLAPRP